MTIIAYRTAIASRARACVRVRRGQWFAARVRVVSPPVPDGYVFGALSPAQIAEDRIIAARGRTARFLERYAAGNRAYGFLTQDGSIAAYGWCSGANDSGVVVPWELGVRLDIPAGTLYVWDCYTMEHHRRRGLYTQILLAMRAYAYERGAARMVMCAADENAPSRAGIVAAGFRSIGAYAITRVGAMTVLRAGSHRSVRWGSTPHPFSWHFV
ncbi:MAG: hypothetical protein Q7S96_02860 [bacterium]|nr:hypothetical protein [bacterium]